MAWRISPVTTADFGQQQGWTSPTYKRLLIDYDGNGTADFIGFGQDRVTIGWGNQVSGPLGSSGPGFIMRGESYTSMLDFGTSDGYNNSLVRVLEDVGNFGTFGTREFIGQGYSGLIWYASTSETRILADGSPPNESTYYIQNYSSARFIAEFGINQGWSSAHDLDFERLQVNDQYASVVGFGDNGLIVAPQAFGPTYNVQKNYAIQVDVGNSAGWNNQRDARWLDDYNGNRVDLNNDGVLDFLGAGPQGLVYSYGFLDNTGRWLINDPVKSSFGFTRPAGDLGADQGWDQRTSPRYYIDMNKDGVEDIIAFGYDGVYVARGQAGGGDPFGPLTKVFDNLGIQQGWGDNPDYLRLLGDVDGDGDTDIVAFGYNKTYVAKNTTVTAGDPVQFFSQAEFESSSNQIQDLGIAQGWNNTQYNRALADVNADGKAEIVASGYYGTWTYDFA